MLIGISIKKSLMVLFAAPFVVNFFIFIAPVVIKNLV